MKHYAASDLGLHCLPMTLSQDFFTLVLLDRKNKKKILHFGGGGGGKYQK